MIIRLRLITVVAALLAFSTPLRAADELATARELYAAAAYEDALQMLNRLRAGGTGDRFAIEQYRAFCLLALGRPADAQLAIEAVVTAQPSYMPSSDVSPRVRTAFSDVRKRMLPGLIQDTYARAKSAYDRKDFAAAASDFQQVLTALSDPDVGLAAGRPPLSDLRTLATGFQELAAAAAAPPPPPPAPEPIAAPPLPVVEAPVIAAAPPPAPVVPKPMYPYGPEDTNVVPPAVVRQKLPDFQRKYTPGNGRPGVLEVLINEAGAVESAIMRVSIHPTYDALVIDAAKTWRYKPATVNGRPVRYRKVMTIAVEM